MITRSLRPAMALTLALILACTDGSRTGSLAPRGDLVDGGGTISGQLLGPDGTNLCNFIPDGSGLVVRVLNPPPAAPSFAGSQFLGCPDNAFSIPVAAGTYLMRVTLPPDPAIGALPVRYLLTTPVVVDGADVLQNIKVVPGSGLGGGATFDGAPLAGVDLGFTYGEAPGYAAIEGTSGADGSWVDFLGREPMIVQDNVRYRVPFPSCGALGTKVLQGAPQDDFLFPNELSAINCMLTTAPNVAFSHTLTRLAVTPMPGNIGGLSGELFDQFGEGWGVQFPIPAGQAPVHGSISISHLFDGGLIVGLRPDRVLTGFGFSGYGQCGGACRDFGLDGKMSYSTSPQFGTKVVWHYSDAISPEGVGLKVLQQSYDGVPPNDYVLFHFAFTNASTGALTFYAGMFADWDIGPDASDDVGASALDGRLMFMTDATPGGVYAGTLLLGDYPVSGTAFLTQFGQSTATQVAALAGDFTVPTAPDPADHRYLQALGPITLKPDGSADIWIAVVAGENQDQFLANANAAAGDVSLRRAKRRPEAAGWSAGPDAIVLGGGQGDGKRLDPRCKKGCAH